MTVEEHDRIDIASIDRDGRAILTISDHLEWDRSAEHQQILQAKLNKYLACVESGEVFSVYPISQGKKIVFKVAFKCRPDPDGIVFLKRAREIVQKAGFELEWDVFAESYDN